MQQVLEKIEKGLAALEKVMSFFVIVAIVVMSLSVIISVFTRNMDIPITWLEELARYMQVWFVCLGSGLAFRHNNLPGIEFFRDLLPPKIRQFVISLGKVIMVYFLWQLVAHGKVLFDHVVRTGQISANLRIPMGWVYAGPLVGFSLMTLFIIVSILRDFFPVQAVKEGK
ncbi:MAG TPA: TRAP transporter small permease [Bacillota bacterium]